MRLHNIIIALAVCAMTVMSADSLAQSGGANGRIAEEEKNGRIAEEKKNGRIAEEEKNGRIAEEKKNERIAEENDSFFESTAKQKFPAFGMFKENYIAGGWTIKDETDKHHFNVRYQTSWQFRLGRFENIDILASYTQTGIWMPFDKSSPMIETAFNPALIGYWYYSREWDFYAGIEHRSNGGKGNTSRSENTAHIGAIYSPSEHWQFGGKIWYGYTQRVRGYDWWRYRGVCSAWATYRSLDNRFSITALVNPSHHFCNYNWEITSYYRLTSKGTFLLSLFAQYRQGYMETMVNFPTYESHLRFGLSLELANGRSNQVR